MRFRLPTLLIAITLACLYFACVAFLRQRAELNRKHAADLVSQISAVENNRRDEIASSVLTLADGKLPITTRHIPIDDGPDRIVAVQNESVVVFVNEGQVEKWQRAIYHLRTANVCERATVLPWVLFTESPAP